MNCDRLQDLLLRSVDRELEDSEKLLLDEHVKNCTPCREKLENLREDDAILRSALETRREALPLLAERTIARLREEGLSRSPLSAEDEKEEACGPTHRERKSPSWRRRLPGWLVAAAAGFVVALLVFRPWEGQLGGPDTPAPAPVARLAVAVGDLVEAYVRSKASWVPLVAADELYPGTRVRTGSGARCELRLADGSLARLDEGSELLLDSARKLSLSAGRLWTHVEHGEGTFSVDVPPARARVIALGTEFEVVASEVRRARVLVLKGTTRVEALERSESAAVVDAGETIDIVDGELQAKQAVRDLLLATSWMHEILVLKERTDPELIRRIDDLFAQIGAQKMAFLYEKEIRALGDHCVIPMTRYLQSDRSAGQTVKRVTAARILADVAQPWSIPDLIELLGDGQAEVRYHAERALLRLSARDGGRSLAEWRAMPPDEIAREQDAWRVWWESNKDRYPPAP